MTKTFRDLGVHRDLCDALESRGITHPFPIQELTLPLALDGHDLIGQARTGTGKTLAFGLPLLQRIDPSLKQTQALVIAPTRELASQVHDDLAIGEALGLTSEVVYGGTPYEEQTENLQAGAHVVVGTPGRLLDHLDRGNLDLSGVTQLVLDEADEMLDMGFLPDVERLIEACTGEDRHTMLFSATMPTAIVRLARRYMQHPTFTRADHEERHTAPLVTQHFFQVHRMDKPRVLARILQAPDRGGVYVFVRTKHMADRLVTELEELGTPAVPIHGDLRQTAREKNLERFRSGKATVLIATEVAARGLDVSGVTHVINYDCPDDEKMYLHRIGRTARAGEAGVAVTFAEFNEADRLNVIRKKVGATDTEVLPIFSTSPELTELFNLPDEKPWDAQVRETLEGTRTDRRTEGRSKDRDRGRARSDGRPKNRREQGSSRRSASAPRDRREPRTDRDEADTDRSRDRSRSANEPPTGARRDRDADAQQPREGRTRERAQGEERVRTRTRTRTRADDLAPRDDTDSTTDAGGRTRSQGRSRSQERRSRSQDDARATRSVEGSGTTSGADAREPDRRDRERQPSGEKTSPPRERARRRSAGGTARNDGPSDDTRSREATSGEDRRSQTSADRSRARKASSGSSDDDRRKRSSRSRGGQPHRKNGRSSKGGTSAGKTPNGRPSKERGGREGEAPGVFVRRGAEARGEGDPQLARRVRVEKLP